MTNLNEQFVAEPSDLEKVLDTKVVLTSSYKNLVASLQDQNQDQNQELTDKLMLAMEENARLREQLQKLTTNKELAKVSLPNFSAIEKAYTTSNASEPLKAYVPPF